MKAASGSSGDLLADRRFAWAMALVREGDDAGAADLLEQVAERVPAWAAGWAALGDAREKLGDEPGALAAWERTAELDTDGRFGAGIKMARLKAIAPSAMPAAYIRALFDGYAPRFDQHLVEALHYRGPAVLAAALAEVAPGRRFARALDLGCGTGLMGGALRPLVERIDGVDLSPAMVAQAKQTGAYTDLAVGSLEAALQAEPSAFDLLTAADVLVYCGDLAPIMAGAALALASGGLFGFTLQRGGGTAEYTLGSDLRFAHAPDYARASVEAAGLTVLRLEEASTRSEKGRDVPGLLIVARRA